MSPIDPNSLSVSSPLTIVDNRECVRCGYNLKGLRIDSVCPECGRAIQLKEKDVPRYTDALIHAPKLWLTGLALGSTLLFASLIIVLLLFFVMLFVPERAKFSLAVFQTGAAACWYIGVLMTTQPRPVMPTTRIDPRREWRDLRLGARITQFFWILMPILMAVYWYLARGAAGAFPPTPLPGAAQGLVWGAIACFAVAAVGLIWLCVYLSNIAFWGDDEVGTNFRTAAWLVGAAATLTFLDVLNSMTNAILMGGFWASLVRVLFMFFIVTPVAYLIFCVYRLQHMTRWAITNHAIADFRSRRLQAQARKNARRGPSAPTSKVPAAGPIDLAADSTVNPADARPAPAPLTGPTSSRPKTTTGEATYDLDQP